MGSTLNKNGAATSASSSLGARGAPTGRGAHEARTRFTHAACSAGARNPRQLAADGERGSRRGGATASGRPRKRAETNMWRRCKLFGAFED